MLITLSQLIYQPTVLDCFFHLRGTALSVVFFLLGRTLGLLVTGSLLDQVHGVPFVFSVVFGVAAVSFLLCYLGLHEERS